MNDCLSKSCLVKWKSTTLVVHFEIPSNHLFDYRWFSRVPDWRDDLSR